MKKIANPLPSVEFLRQILDYDPETGIFTWKRRTDLPPMANGWNKRMVGARAGRISTMGHRQIGIDGTLYLAHRLAWLYVYGTPPKYQIDHINAVRDDNGIANLRESDQAQNQHNRSATAGRKLPKGVRQPVRLLSGKLRYRANIVVSRKIIGLGSYDSAEEAHAAYLAAAKLHFGEFARAA